MEVSIDEVPIRLRKLLYRKNHITNLKKKNVYGLVFFFKNECCVRQGKVKISIFYRYSNNAFTKVFYRH